MVTTLKRPRALPPLALLMLQLLLGVLAPVADARGEREAADAVVHVESDDRPPCPTGHNHLQCQFCRHVGSNLLATTSIEHVPQRSAARTRELPAADYTPRCTQAGYPLGSRAPPLV